MTCWCRSMLPPLTRTRTKAKRAGLHYSFLRVAGHGEQLAKIAALIEQGAIRPVVDRVFPFEQTNEALAYIEQGRATGKVIVKVR